MPRKIVPIIMGSDKDFDYAQQIGGPLREAGLEVPYRVGSGHKTPEHVMDIMSEYSDLIATKDNFVFVTVAGRSNGLGGAVAANTSWPVITSPPAGDSFFLDLPSSLMMPSDVPLITAMSAGAAVRMVKSILRLYVALETLPPAAHNCMVSGSDADCAQKVRKKLGEFSELKVDEKVGMPRVYIHCGPEENNCGDYGPVIFCYKGMLRHILDGELSERERKKWENRCVVLDPENAALAAANIAAGIDPELRERLVEYYAAARQRVIDADKKMKEW